MLLRRRDLLFVPAAPMLAVSGRPEVTAATAGDVTPGQALIWARADRASRMTVRWRTGSGPVETIVGPYCLETTDFTGRVNLAGLPAGQQISYEVEFQDLRSPRAVSEPAKGSFRTPGARRNVRFLWSGDMVGQGWGINPDRGGITIFETMRRREPDFFLHSGDTIYADGPVPAEVKLTDGSVWRNVTTPEKSKAAETLDEFRGAYRYNLLDTNVRKFGLDVPQVWQWDDHEVTNNWSPSKDLSADSKYTMKDLDLLVARGQRAFLEYAPIRYSNMEADRVYRHIPYGPLLDVFVIDLRSHRGPNTHNMQTMLSAETDFLGARQIAWLKQGLRESRAVWKVIASDMPIGLHVPDGRDAEGRPRWEASANGDNGPALGRELEIAEVLRFIKRQKIRNTVWLTADVHYTAAHYYDPAKARFTDFNPFWEFVSGPLNAGTFGPGQKDLTFGLEAVFEKAPPKGQSNLPPSAGLQFFGEVEIDARTRAMTVTLRDMTGAGLFTKTLPPA
ncbi:MAG: alkaline phosphatase [Acidobacteria bacterium]|nr:alkaline phosphatase [Acidobacteriota bacterium]